jgi:hypothetical protein
MAKQQTKITMGKMGRRDKNCKACQFTATCPLSGGTFTHCPKVDMIPGNGTEKLFFFEYELEDTFSFKNN